MKSVDEIVAAIRELDADKFSELKKQLTEIDAYAWDRQIEADADTGRLDEFANEALAELRRSAHRAEIRYSGLTVTCNRPTVDRFIELVRTELGIVTPAPSCETVNYVTVRVDTPPSGIEPSWIEWLGLILAVGVSAILYLAGCATVLRWVLH
jgi:hypothetical protein